MVYEGEYKQDEHDPIVCRCGCGRTFVGYEWADLKLVGYQAAEDPDQLCEMRNCHCGSTRSVLVPGPGFWVALAQVRLVEARTEAHGEKHALAESYLERAATCMQQAVELHRVLNAQKARAAQAYLQAAE